jgi:hypothetical protein
MSTPIVTAELIAQHEPRGGAAHVVILAGASVAVLVVIGLSRWRRNRSRAEHDSNPHDRSAADQSGDRTRNQSEPVTRSETRHEEEER